MPVSLEVKRKRSFGKGKCKIQRTKKARQKKVQHVENNLESTHNEIVQGIKNKYERKIGIVSAENKMLEKRRTKLKRLDKIQEVSNKIEKNEEEIERYKDNLRNELEDYYLKSHKYFVQYYQEDTNKNNSFCDDENNEDKYFADITTLNSGKYGRYNKNFRLKKYNDKASVYEKYKRKVDPNYVFDSKIQEYRECPLCHNNNKITASEGQISCMNCGYEVDVKLEGVRLSYHDISMRQNNESYSYSKQGHLKSNLQNLQGKPVAIPEEVFKELDIERKAEKIPKHKLRIRKIREWLKRNDRSNYYENSNYIMEKMGGPKSPKLSRELIEQVETIFIKIQVPFKKYRHLIYSQTPNKDRRNFFIYNYILYKIFQLLGQDYILEHLILPKTQSNKNIMDEFWYYICHDCDLEYIS